LPKAIILGVIIIISLYLCANAAYVHVIGFSQLAQAKSIAAIVVQSLFGNAGSLLLSAVLVISVFGYINVSMLSNPRVLQAMSEDGVLPKTWAKGKAEKGVNVFALIIFTLLSIICVFAGKSFETILNYTIFLDSIGLAVGISTLYRLKGEKISPLIHAATGFFILSCLYTSCNIFIFDTQAGVYGSALFAVIFICGWFITKKSQVKYTS
jgi:APA family basic amino acid/polyamine antiporter